MEWQEAIEKVSPYIVKITTSRGSGTGFLLWHSETAQVWAIATAAHVISHEHKWQLPIRIEHHDSGQSILLHDSNRAIQIDNTNDTAAIMFASSSIPFPSEQLELIAEGYYLKLGNEVGWTGFPAAVSSNLCFFTGRISSYIEDEKAYLIDGVVISGVSGCPAFAIFGDDVVVVGVASAYIPNRSTGDALPGLSVVEDVGHLHSVIKEYKSFDEAMLKESDFSGDPTDPQPSM